VASPRRVRANSFPIAHKLLAAAGLIVPPDARFGGNFASSRGVAVDADQITVAPGTEVVINDGVAYLTAWPGEVNGTIWCKCAGGSEGTCDVLLTQTPSGDDAIGCVDNTCTRCITITKINRPSALALVALDIQIEPGATVVGDLRRGAVVTSGGVTLGPDSPFTLEQGNNVVYLMTRAAAPEKAGEFKCACGTIGDCKVEVTITSVTCQTGTCTMKCHMTLEVPALQLSFAAR
jgi:hypothetical protein